MLEAEELLQQMDEEVMQEFAETGSVQECVTLKTGIGKLRVMPFGKTGDRNHERRIVPETVQLLTRRAGNCSRRIGAGGRSTSASPDTSASLKPHRPTPATGLMGGCSLAESGRARSPALELWRCAGPAHPQSSHNYPDQGPKHQHQDGWGSRACPLLAGVC